MPRKLDDNRACGRVLRLELPKHLVQQLNVGTVFLCLFIAAAIAAADSVAQSLRELLAGVTRVSAAYISRFVRAFQPPYFVPGYKKVPFFFTKSLPWIFRRGLRFAPSSQLTTLS